MPQQLAALIREKYPGQYDDMDDAALEAAVLEKYPEYADLVEEPAIEPAPVQEEDSFISSILDPLWRGPERLGASIAESIDPGPTEDMGQTEAMLRGGLAGMIGGTRGPEDDRWRGLGGLLSDVTSPIELGGLALGGIGKFGRPAIRGLASMFRGAPVEEAAPVMKMLPEPHHRFVGGVGRGEGGKFARTVEDVSQTPEGGVIRDMPDIDVAPTRVTEVVRGVDEAADIMPPVTRLNDSILSGTKLAQVDVDDLAKTITQAELNLEDKAQAYETLKELLEGGHPSVKNMRVLERIFGDEIPLPKKKASLITEVVNFPRAIQSSMDISAPFRQGLGLIHTKAWWTSWDDMLKSFGSEKAYEGVMDSIRSNPLYDLAEKSGVNFTDLRQLSTREEAIMNTWAEKVPFVRRSNRAYTAFLNKLRMDAYKSLVDSGRAGANSALKTAGDNRQAIEAARAMNPDENPKLAKELADFINNASGRGNLAGAEKYAQELNLGFYSPRFIASRVQMLNPRNYLAAPPQVRKEYLKSMAAITGTWSTIASLAAMGGADVSMEPTSADFGKIRIGDTRIDPGGGFQQYLVLFNRLRKQETTSSTTGRVREFGEGYGAPTSLSTLGRFTTNKFQPLTKFAWDALNAGEDAPFNAMDRTAQLFIPMMVQDLIEVGTENPELLPITIPATAVGMGSSTYRRGDFGEPQFIGEGALIDPGSF